MGLIERMRKLKTLLGIRLGLGAAVLPKDVKRIHMDFAFKLNDGHLGPRKFWRHYLPRLKYHNPTVSMTVNRTGDQAGPATMTIFYAPTSETTSPGSTGSSSAGSIVNERLEVIDMKHKHESEILKRLMEVTKAVQVKPTEEEEQELKEMAARMPEIDEDRRRSRADLEKTRSEAALLAQAAAAIA